jgi:hypothetical protein
MAVPQQRAPANPHVILTPSAQLRACSGRDLAAFHSAISEMVRFTHHDIDVQGLVLQIQCNHHRIAPQPHVILTPAAQLKACSGRDRAGRYW